MRDGAYQLASAHTPEGESPVHHEVLRAAAMAIIPPIPHGRAVEFDDLRASCLMHILAVQDGDFELVQIMLGRYYGITACLKFHNERFWPPNLEEWQREERRALVSAAAVAFEFAFGLDPPSRG